MRACHRWSRIPIMKSDFEKDFVMKSLFPYVFLVSLFQDMFKKFMNDSAHKERRSSSCSVDEPSRVSNFVCKIIRSIGWYIYLPSINQLSCFYNYVLNVFFFISILVFCSIQQIAVSVNLITRSI